MLADPCLEMTGPEEFRLENVTGWLHERQESNRRGSLNITGHDIRRQLISEDMLKSCLSIQEGLAIMDKGIIVFNELLDSMKSFPTIVFSKVCFLWRSTFYNGDGVAVPYICGFEERMICDFRYLDQLWFKDDLALCFDDTMKS